MEKRRLLETDSAFLHILAMALMLCDHAWATLPIPFEWMTNIGRIAFPIFAFMTVEGYFHTRSLKKYLLRLLLFAALSEIPFNLMMGASVLYPYHQNVLWTFLLGLLSIVLIDGIRKKGKLWLAILVGILIALVDYILGYLLAVDYYGPGILTVLVFYAFRGSKWWQRLLRLLALYYINVELLGGYCFDITLFGRSFEVVQQGLALFALIPIELYRGRQGYHSKPFQYLCYAFYPVHMLVLFLISLVF